MSVSRQLEILCTACGSDAILVREPRYEGLRKSGETLSCAACGHEYADENSVPFKQKNPPKVFDHSDAAPVISVFRESEKGRICRYCKHYVVNPFSQRCGLSFKAVEATDSCPKFEIQDKPAEKPEIKQPPASPLR
ncbi:MAG: hypothetical protein WCL44_09915 [bacterium]